MTSEADVVFGCGCRRIGQLQGGPDPGFRGQVVKISSDITDLCPDFKSLCPKGAYVRRIHMCDFSSSSEEVSTASDYQDNLKIVRRWLGLMQVHRRKLDGCVLGVFAPTVPFQLWSLYLLKSNSPRAALCA